MTKWMMIAAIGLAAALPAAAQPAPSPAAIEKQVRIPVSYQDLDLSTAADLQTLQQRLAKARHTACTAAFHGQPFAAQQINTCLYRAANASRQQLAAVLAGYQLASGAGTGDGQRR